MGAARMRTMEDAVQSNWRDLAVFLDASPQGERVGAVAAGLAQRHGAHLIGVYGVGREDSSPHDSFARGEGAIRDVLERQRSVTEEKLLAAGRRFADLARAHGVSSEFRVAWQDAIGDESVLRGLHCDLIVSGHPRLRDLPADWSAERLLLATGTPVLTTPAAWEGETLGDTVLIAWNRSREARRAVNDAMPFIGRARRVVVLIVDGDRDPDRFGEDPGANLMQHLARHDVAAELVQASTAGGHSVAEVIMEQAGAHGADLLVMGAYSRPRTAEVLFGGTTRTLLAQARIPLLISR